VDDISRTVFYPAFWASLVRLECHAEANCQATVIPESHRLGPV